MVVGAFVTGGVAATAAAQAPAGPAPAEPPTDNVFPVPLPYEVDVADSWGACRDDCERRHKGNDLMADEGTPAVAVEAGVIAKVDDTDDGLGGLTVWLRGDSGVAYYYAHNAENLVAEGQRVARGQTIARVGHTGNARTTPSHIHFQINLCGELTSDEPCTVDPHPYLQSWQQDLVDGGADGVGWYEPSTAAFGQRSESGAPLPSYPFGEAGADAVPVAGDWDGDGQDSVGIYRRSDATFHLRDDQGAALEPLPFGEAGRTDVWPVAGDFDGDGRDTVGLYRQADATFVVLVDLGVESAPVALGTPGRPDTLPVTGDWDGDGRDSVGVYQQGDAMLGRLDDGGRAIEPTVAGVPGPETFPVAGDWDGDGRDEVGVLRRDAAAFELPVPAAVDPAGVRSVPIEPGADALPMAGDWNGRDLVTIDELRQIYGEIPDEAKVVEGLPALNAAMLRAGITTPARKAAFLATLRNESGFRYDAVEADNGSRYRGRGYIQLTGRSNYSSAGEFLELDLVGEPDLAANGLASPAIAAWYWTVARNINVSADALDMAAVNIAVGYAPTERRDAQRCSDFQAALRYYSGGEATGEINCDRNEEARLRAFTAIVPWMPGVSDAGASPAATVEAVTAIPTGLTPPSAGSPAPPDPIVVPAGAPTPTIAPRPVSSTTTPAPTAPTTAESTAATSGTSLDAGAPAPAPPPTGTQTTASSIAPDDSSTTTLSGG